MSTLVSPSAQRAGAHRRDRAIGVLGAVLVNALLGLGAALAGQELTVQEPGKEAIDLGVGALAVVTLGVGLLGWALLAVLERFAPSRAFTIWAVVAMAVLVLSFLPLLGVEAEGATKVILALAHLTVAAVLLPVFRRTTRG
jgi:hypothetical protein